MSLFCKNQYAGQTILGAPINFGSRTLHFGCVDASRSQAPYIPPTITQLPCVGCEYTEHGGLYKRTRKLRRLHGDRGTPLIALGVAEVPARGLRLILPHRITFPLSHRRLPTSSARLFTRPSRDGCKLSLESSNLLSLGFVDLSRTTNACHDTCICKPTSLAWGFDGVATDLSQVAHCGMLA